MKSAVSMSPKKIHRETNTAEIGLFRVLPNDSDGVDDAMATISAPPFVVATTRIGTASGCRRFVIRGGDGS
jgi:hypothetical protein